MTSDDKVGGWVKKGQNHDDVILEWSLSNRHKINQCILQPNYLQSLSQVEVNVA